MNLSPHVSLHRDWFSILLCGLLEIEQNKSLFFSVGLHCHIHWASGSLCFPAGLSESWGYFSSVIYRCENVCSTNYVILCVCRFSFWISHTWLDRVIKHIHSSCDFQVTKIVIVCSVLFFPPRALARSNITFPCFRAVKMCTFFPFSVAWQSSISKKSEAF